MILDVSIVCVYVYVCVCVCEREREREISKKLEQRFQIRIYEQDGLAKNARPWYVIRPKLFLQVHTCTFL